MNKEINNNFKFNIFNCNQIILLLFKKTKIVNNKAKIIKLNLTDLQLLQWFYDFQNTNKMMKIINPRDNKTYCWINYKKVVEEFPLLELTKQTVYLSFKKLTEFCILEHYCSKMGGTFSCYKINEKIFDCIYYENNKTTEEIDKNIDTLHKDLLTPSYNFIDPLNKDLLNKILYYYNNSTIKEILSKDNKRTSIDSKESIKRINEESSNPNGLSNPSNSFNSLKEQQIKHSKDKINIEPNDFTKKIMKILYNKIIKLHPKLHKNKYFSNKEIKTVENYINYYIKGFPKNNFSKLRNFIDKDFDNKILEGFKIKDSFEKAFLESIKIYDYNYQPNDKSKLPSRCSEFLISYTGFSYFLYYFFNNPKPIIERKEDKYSNITNLYLKQYLGISKDKLNIEQYNNLVKYIKQIIQEHKDICNLEILYNNKKYKRCDIEYDDFYSYIGNLDYVKPFVQEHIRYMNIQAENNDKFNREVKYLRVGSYYWKQFERWFYKTHELEFFPDKQYMTMICKENMKYIKT